MAAFGLVWGSYLNVVVYRLPRGMSTAVPSSHCPRCSVRIRPYDNVPVLSWILLGARCRACRGNISVRYPLVEAAVGGAFVAGFHRFDHPAEIFASWVLACVLIALVLIDFDRRLVPVVLTIPWMLTGWAVQPLLHWTHPWNAVLAAILGAALVLGASEIWRLFFGQAGFGAGDAYVLAMIGAFFGVAATLRVALLALLLAVAVVGVQTAAARLARRTRHYPNAQRSLPMATLLGLAALWVLLLAPEIPGTVLAATMMPR